jgi:hypothetical protein
MRALRLKTQWSRSNAAAAIDIVTKSIPRVPDKATEVGDPRLRRRANVFVVAPKMTTSFADRIRLILPHVLLFCTTVLYGILGAVCFSYTEQGYETGHMGRYSKNAIAAQVRKNLSTLSLNLNIFPLGKKLSPNFLECSIQP